MPNGAGMRPAEKVAASLISWMGGGVQPANSGLPLPGRGADQVLARLKAIEDPEAARSAERGPFVMEVFRSPQGASLQHGASADLSDRGLAGRPRRCRVRGGEFPLHAAGRLAERAASETGAQEGGSGSPRCGVVPADRDPLAARRARAIRRHRRFEKRVHRGAGVRGCDEAARGRGERARGIGGRAGRAAMSRLSSVANPTTQVTLR